MMGHRPSDAEVMELSRQLLNAEKIALDNGAEADNLRADLERARAALRTYGAHPQRCAGWKTIDPDGYHVRSFDAAKCDCGLVAALAVVPEPGERPTTGEATRPDCGHVTACGWCHADAQPGEQAARGVMERVARLSARSPHVGQALGLHRSGAPEADVLVALVESLVVARECCTDSSPCRERLAARALAEERDRLRDRVRTLELGIDTLKRAHQKAAAPATTPAAAMAASGASGVNPPQGSSVEGPNRDGGVEPEPSRFSAPSAPPSGPALPLGHAFTPLPGERACAYVGNNPLSDRSIECGRTRAEHEPSGPATGESFETWHHKHCNASEQSKFLCTGDNYTTGGPNETGVTCRERHAAKQAARPAPACHVCRNYGLVRLPTGEEDYCDCLAGDEALAADRDKPKLSVAIDRVLAPAPGEARKLCPHGHDLAIHYCGFCSSGCPCSAPGEATPGGEESCVCGHDGAHFDGGGPCLVEGCGCRGWTPAEGSKP